MVMTLNMDNNICYKQTHIHTHPLAYKPKIQRTEENSLKSDCELNNLFTDRKNKNNNNTGERERKPTTTN